MEVKQWQALSATVLPERSGVGLNDLLGRCQPVLLIYATCPEFSAGNRCLRTSPTTVMYTEGSSYQYDVSRLGLNLDTDFPHQRALTLLLDDQNQLKGVISNDESNKITDIFAFGLVFGMIEMAVIMIVYTFFVRKHTPYGKKWSAFMKWFETRDDTLLDIIRE